MPRKLGTSGDKFAGYTRNRLVAFPSVTQFYFSWIYCWRVDAFAGSLALTA